MDERTRRSFLKGAGYVLASSGFFSGRAGAPQDREADLPLEDSPPPYYSTTRKYSFGPDMSGRTQQQGFRYDIYDWARDAVSDFFG